MNEKVIEMKVQFTIDPDTIKEYMSETGTAKPSTYVDSLADSIREEIDGLGGRVVDYSIR
jgi:hypothetical protein